MNARIWMAACIGAACIIGGAQEAQAIERTNVRFVPLDLFVDTHGDALAAYQIEIVVKSGDAQIVGVEGGDDSQFKDAPYYDARALMGGRIILASLTTDRTPPKGRFRLATLHVREEGALPHYEVRRIVVADRDGKSTDATIELKRRDTTK